MPRFRKLRRLYFQYAERNWRSLVGCKRSALLEAAALKCLPRGPDNQVLTTLFDSKVVADIVPCIVHFGEVNISFDTPCLGHIDKTLKPLLGIIQAGEKMPLQETILLARSGTDLREDIGDVILVGNSIAENLDPHLKVRRAGPLG